MPSKAEEISMLKVLRVVALLVLIPICSQAAPPEKLTYEKIAEERHLWPDKVSVKKAFKFVEGSVAQGELVTLMSVGPGSVRICKAKSDLSFETPPETTDLLARASALRQRLTAEQKALDLKALHQRPDLWPTEVTLHGGFTWPNGTKLSDGAVITLTTMDDSQIYIFNMGNKKVNHVDAQATDIFGRAREIMAQPPAKRVTRMARLLQGKLVSEAKPVEGVKPADPPPGIKYYVIVFAASDHADMPKLMADVEKFYESNKAKHPELAVVLYGLDKAMSDRKFPGRVIAASQLASLSWLRDQHDETQQSMLVVLDASGVVVPDRNTSEANTPQARLENLGTLLNGKPEAK
jgi:hypothetical protein